MSPPSDSTSGAQRRRTVGIRQLQKKARMDVGQHSNDGDDSDDWISEVCDIVDCELSRATSQTVVTAPSGDAHVQLANDEYPGSPSVSSSSSGQSLVLACPTRLSEIFSDESSDTSENEDGPDTDANLCGCLREWYIESGVNLKQLGLLLEKLRPFHNNLPKDPRTVVKTPRGSKIRQLKNGTYAHFDISESLLTRLDLGIKANVTTLCLDVNVDGLPLSKSSNLQAWPILMRCKDLCNEKPFPVGIFSGSGKPDTLETFLEDYINDVQQLLAKGITHNDLIYDVKIKSYICDTPARAYLKCIKGHTSYHGCERCLQEGEHDGSRMTYEAKTCAPRTDESFRNQEHEDHHKAISPLTKLPTLFISMFPLDSMHLFFHGAMKRWLSFLLEWPSKAKLSSAQCSVISGKLAELEHYIPCEFARKVRSLAMYARWKATELRQFLLYVGIVALKDVVINEIYSQFLLFFVATRIVSNPEQVNNPEFVDYAEKLFATFVQHCGRDDVFGPSFVVYNIHSLLHVCEDVRRFGDISKFSSFPFENYLKNVKKNVRSGANVTQQLAHRYAEIDSRLSSEAVELPSKLTAHGYVEEMGEYKSLICSKFKLSAQAKKDSFFKVGQNIGCLKKIVKRPSGEAYIIADICENTSDFFTYPVESSKVGVCKFFNWTTHNVTVPIGSIAGKVMVLPCGTEKAAIDLLHTS